MSRSITLPEAEAVSLEAALDRALAALRRLDTESDEGRGERIARLRAETHVLLEQIRSELRHVEETV